MKNTENVWALLANGSHAKLIKKPGDRSEQKVIELQTDNLKAGELKTDRQGRTFASSNSNRSAKVWHTDPVRNQEQLFAEHLSANLLRSMDQGEFESLVVAASPRTLGDLRLAFPERLQKRVVCEVAKDLTNVPDNEAGEAILSLLAKA